MMKTPHRAERLEGLFNLIEMYETPPTKDASTDEGRAFWAAWAADLNTLAANCQKDPLMLYLLAAYTDYMIDAGKAVAETGHGLVWNGDTTEVLIRLTENRVPMVDTFEAIANAPKRQAAAGMEGGWIG